MRCPNCGEQIPDDVTFCPECGQKIADSDRDDAYYDELRGDDSEEFYESDPRKDDSEEFYESDPRRDDSEEFYESEPRRDDSEEFYESESQRDDPEEFYESDPGDRRHHDNQLRGNTPVLITLIIAGAAVLIVCAAMLIQSHSASQTVTVNRSAAASAEHPVSSKKAESTQKSVDTAATPSDRTETATPAPTEAPTAEPTQAETATPVPTQAPQVIVVAPGTTPVPTAPPTVIYVNDDYVFPYSDTYQLTEGDLAGKSAWELTVGRNEIAARHGYVFNREDLQDYFNSKSWYYPVGQFDLGSVLSSTEMRNMSFIDKYQTAHGMQTSG